MDRQTILSALLRRPFEPFVLLLSSGAKIEIRHPELAALGKARILVVDPDTDLQSTISLLHVVAVQELAAA